jgi:HNH endonuclease
MTVTLDDLAMNAKIANKRNPTIYQSIGRCIYCGKDGAKEDLTVEHVMPKGFGGGIIFLGASCESCRVITSRFEDDCLRKDYKHFRADAGMPMNTKIAAKTDYCVVLPVLPRAGILVGRPPTSESLATTVQRLWFRPKQSPTTFPEVAQDNKFRYQSFIRMLAKIAYGYALGQIGPDKFYPLAPDLILWRDPMLLHHLVGCTDPKIDAEMRKNMPITKKVMNDPKSPWTRQQARLYVTSPDGHSALAVVLIRLFPYYPHAPTYEIVVGKLAVDHSLCTHLLRAPTNPTA